MLLKPIIDQIIPRLELLRRKCLKFKVKKIEFNIRICSGLTEMTEKLDKCPPISDHFRVVFEYWNLYPYHLSTKNITYYRQKYQLMEIFSFYFKTAYSTKHPFFPKLPLRQFPEAKQLFNGSLRRFHQCSTRLFYIFSLIYWISCSINICK